MLIPVLLLLQGTVAPDDDRWLREARRAQARFETVRRAHLPFDRATGSAGGPCDARIGRYCYWYDNRQTSPPPEPPRISDARTDLLHVLASAAARVDDGWITGQRIRYLLESGRASDALTIARECRAERWRCAAFEGLGLHVAERYAEADSVFSVALEAMSAEQRCEWLDLRRLVDGGLEREWSRATCEEREYLMRRLFELSQPLWSVSGNDLRTEHLARLTMAEILAGSANAHAMAWSGDSRELLVRYGWSEWYTRQREDVAGLHAEPQVTGHDRQPSYRWFPDVASVREGVRLDSAVWKFRDPLARSRYAPRHLARVDGLSHQLARFPRGDSMLVAVVFTVTDTALARDSLTSWLITRDADLRDRPAVRATTSRGALLATVAAEPLIVSVEVRGSTSRHAARTRYNVDPLSCHRGWCLSDLLLFTPSGNDSLQAALDSAVVVATPDMTFSRRAPLGVLWELQSGSAGAQPVWLGLTVSRVGVSPMRRLASRLKLAPAIAPIHLRWQAVQTSARDTRHVTLRLPQSASGRYRVQLTIEAAGVPTLTASRDIEVRP